MYWDGWYRLWSHLGDKIWKDEVRYFSTFQRCFFIRKDEIRVSKRIALNEQKRHAIRQRFSRMTFNLSRVSKTLHYTQEKTDLWLFGCDIDKKHSGNKQFLSWDLLLPQRIFSVSVTQLLAQMTLSHESAWHYQKSRELVTMIMNHRFGAFWLYFPHI